MYLHKRKKGTKKSLENLSYEEWKCNELAYWRKANAIHKWFVDKVQDGNDDCGEYKVSKEQLQDLLNTCTEVLERIQTEEGDVLEYTQWQDGKETNHYIKARVITNPEICEELLPTASGFFFGGTEYDEYYIAQIEDTIDQLNKIAEELDFSKYDVIYNSSW